MFPSQSIMTFIAIIFRDMDTAHKLFDTAIPKKKEPRFITERAEITREYIKIFIGEYLSRCKDFKYDILEALMKGVVFEKK
jgi:hypothetical protein